MSTRLIIMAMNLNLNDGCLPSDLTSSSSNYTIDCPHVGDGDADSADSDFHGMAYPLLGPPPQPSADQGELSQLIKQAVALYVSRAIAAAMASGSAEHLFAVRAVLQTRDFAAILKATPEYAFLAERCSMLRVYSAPRVLRTVAILPRCNGRLEIANHVVHAWSHRTRPHARAVPSDCRARQPVRAPAQR
ncbi:hypothetical protein T492DRAFT_138335 [Pavlovales sp. CCMP2436]|nr:hypothetical protein T492DRAFT_138335 [Pavlovales sp. CCMP2436]